MLLELQGVHAYYGDSHVLQGVDLALDAGEIVCLLGRNGAGKTTTMKSIVGYVPPARGRVVFDGRDLVGRPVHENVRTGVGYVPEDRRIFAGLTVEENLEVAMLPPRSGVEPWTFGRVFQTFPLLEPLRKRKGGELSGGEQQVLAIARALVGNPRVLLLDEPCEGLAPVVVEELGRVIVSLKGQIPILLAEQNARFALEVSDRGYVIEKGRVVFRGGRRDLLENREIQERYLAV